MHGAGIRAMGRLMDRIMSSVDVTNNDAITGIKKELNAIAPVCKWTSGRWHELGNLSWNEIQNVPRHIRVLSNLLIRAHIQKRVA